MEIDINFSLDFKPEQGEARVKQLLEKREKIIFEDTVYYTLNQYDFFIHLCNGNMAEVEFLNGGRMKVGYTDKKPGKEANGYNS